MDVPKSCTFLYLSYYWAQLTILKGAIIQGYFPKRWMCYIDLLINHNIKPSQATADEKVEIRMVKKRKTFAKLDAKILAGLGWFVKCGEIFSKAATK